MSLSSSSSSPPIPRCKSNVAKAAEHFDMLNTWPPSRHIYERLPKSFAMLLRCVPSMRPSRNHDMQLLSACADLYNSETSTFEVNEMHLYLGLQDVWYFTGLPIVGRAVTGIEESPGTYLEEERFLGISNKLVVAKYQGKTSIRLKDLKELCNHCPSLDQKVRVYLLFIIGCLIYTSEGKVPWFFLSCMEDIDAVDTYAWGAAYLACLHSGLRRFKKLVHKKPYSSHQLSAPAHLIVSFILERCKSVRDSVFEYAYGTKADEVKLPSRLPLLSGWSEILEDFNKSHSRRPEAAFYTELLHKETVETIDMEPFRRPFSNVPKEYACQLSVCNTVVELFCFNKFTLHEPNPQQLGKQGRRASTKKYAARRKGRPTLKLCGNRELPYNWSAHGFYKKRVPEWEKKPWESNPYGEVIEVEEETETTTSEYSTLRSEFLTGLGVSEEPQPSPSPTKPEDTEKPQPSPSPTEPECQTELEEKTPQQQPARKTQRERNAPERLSYPQTYVRRNKKAVTRKRENNEDEKETKKNLKRKTS